MAATAGSQDSGDATPRVVDNRRVTTERFTDEIPKDIYAYMGETLVVCPKCGSCALSRQVDGQQPGWFGARRLTCTKCGYTDDWKERAISRGWDRARDDYFHLPLWLQTPCCGDVLWVYNAEHLAELERYVGAKLRERSRDPEFGWSNRAYFSRLPAWIKAAKNRDEALRAIAKLRERLAAKA